MSNKTSGSIFMANNLGYLHKKLSLLEQTSYFNVLDLVEPQGVGKHLKRFNDLLDTIKEDVQTLMYALARQIWEDASNYENLESGKNFSTALKKSFSLLKTFEIRDDYARGQLGIYWESEVKRVFKTYIDGIDEDDEDDIKKVLNNQNTLLVAIQKIFNKK